MRKKKSVKQAEGVYYHSSANASSTNEPSFGAQRGKFNLGAVQHSLEKSNVNICKVLYVNKI